MSAQMLNVGVDVGGTNIKFGVADENGKFFCRISRGRNPIAEVMRY